MTVLGSKDPLLIAGTQHLRGESCTCPCIQPLITHLLSFMDILLSLSAHRETLSEDPGVTDMKA